MTESLREGNLVCKNICLNIFFEDVAITLIDKTDGRDPKNRENYWMRTLETLAPQGLNIEDCV